MRSNNTQQKRQMNQKIWRALCELTYSTYEEASLRYEESPPILGSDKTESCKKKHKNIFHFIFFLFFF
jgi:hypothetical protein